MSITTIPPVSAHALAGYDTDATSRDGRGATDTVNAFASYEASTTGLRKTTASDQSHISSPRNGAYRIEGNILRMKGDLCKQISRNIQSDDDASDRIESPNNRRVMGDITKTISRNIQPD